MSLLLEVERFAAAKGISLSRLTELAVGDTSFASRIRSGRVVGEWRATRLRKFMAENIDADLRPVTTVEPVKKIAPCNFADGSRKLLARIWREHPEIMVAAQKAGRKVEYPA